MKTLAAVLSAMVLLPALALAQGKESVQLSVHQKGVALVDEVRTVALPAGAGTVALPDLPETIVPESLRVRSKTAPEALDILGLATSDAGLTPSALLKRHLGQKVGVILPDGKSRDGRVRKEAVLLTADTPPLLLLDGQVYSGPVEAILYADLPSGLAAKPAHTLDVVNRGQVKQRLDISYLAAGISWRMDYQLVLDKAGTSGLLTGWVTLSNRTGRAFENAAVNLLAGDARTEDFENSPAAPARAMLAMAKADFPAAASEPVFEYHSYHLPRPVSLQDQQSRLVPLFDAAKVQVTRALVGRAQARPMRRDGDPRQEKLDVQLSFRNAKSQGLGLPMPEGRLMVVEETGGARHLLGGAALGRVPAGAEAKATIGQAFDLNVERVCTAEEKTGKTSWRATWELRITNAKDKVQRIFLREEIPGKWKVETASHKWTKAAANVLEFAVDVPPTGEGAPMLLTYSFATEE